MENRPTQIQISIQRATWQHLEGIVSIIRQTSKWLKTKGVNQWSESFPVSRLEEEVLKDELFVVLDTSKRIVGTISLSGSSELWNKSGTDAIYLNRLAIVRACSGLNLGSGVVAWAKDYARQRDVNLLRLNCDKENPFLPEFYKKCGFKCVGETFYSPWQMTFCLFEMPIESGKLTR